MTAAEPKQSEVRVTVDGAAFYGFIRGLKRGWRVADVGTVELTTHEGILRIATRRGESVLPCTPARAISARVRAGDLLRLVRLPGAGEATGPVTVVFRPALGEIALPQAGMKARFEPVAQRGHEES